MKTMTKKKTSIKNRVPDFSSLEEEAQWFDTHDIGDYMDEFKVVDPKTIRFALHDSDNIIVPLDAATSKKVKTISSKKGMQPTALVQSWIAEVVDKELKHFSHS